MKIGFIIGSLNYSGAEKIARYLIDVLHNQYHYEIGVILLSGEGPYSDIDYIKQFVIKTKGNKFLRVYNRQKQIRNIVNLEKYEIVISFGVKFNIDAMEALKNTNTKVILCERNDPVNDPHRKILRIRRRIIYPFATGYIFQTRRIGNFFGKKIFEKGTVIPNFIERPMKNLYSEKNENNIVITARLDDVQKNISLLLRAFYKFSQSNDYHLYIVGNGPDEKKLKFYAQKMKLEDRVHFMGKKNVYDYLKIAKIFVLSSNYEGMPNSLIEAMASGIPSIATDCNGGGAAELIQDHVNGTLVPINDEDAMVNALNELANSSKLRKQYSEKAYELNKKLEMNYIIKLWVSYIEKIAKL